MFFIRSQWCDMPNTRYGKEFHSTGAAYEKVLLPRVGRNESGGGTNKSSLLLSLQSPTTEYQ